MAPFDFRVQVKNGEPFPLLEPDFMFGVSGTPKAAIDGRGVYCGTGAGLQLTNPANVVELAVINGSQVAIITAFGAGGLTNSKNVPSAPGVQHVRFDFAGIYRVKFESMGSELYLQTIS
ncbi:MULTISPECIES: hypothetical protein [unclassified Bradyrhizobium]|uniref:hypothetical protein n=1 Tax=unclassified Bradyrhizobium TaxID=2631580 RepID=UPI001FF8FA23|nr:MULTISPECIES: hypothetical protein [unclassified Bradyrhizobium]MCK1538680.1 hypothetical protein [Bradyrhizobium sp. 176]MCK1558622.1 hypothetical protein [Bradyrhizobium sp. 171]MCK1689583.1 hypothetical protein [Bradyrhizobium sp. 145]